MSSINQRLVRNFGSLLNCWGFGERYSSTAAEGSGLKNGRLSEFVCPLLAMVWR